MTYFLKTGNVCKVLSEQAVVVTTSLEAKTYTVKQNPMTKEFFLEDIDNFELPKKLYGNTLKNTDRVLNTFMQRSSSTGLHLNGVKGSGKTLLAKCISLKAIEMGIPTIVINSNFTGDQFNQFIQSIDTDCVIIFDEFEKIYGWSDQEKILTLLDGVYQSKKLFIITTNDSQSVSNHLKNRPGRIFYSFKYDVLDINFVSDYLDDNLRDLSKKGSILNYAKIFSFFNFDMLSAVVEEMNRYNESLDEVLEFLNVSPENKQSDKFSVKFKVGNFEKIVEHNLKEQFSPITFEYWVNFSDIKNELSPELSEKLQKYFFDPDQDDLEFNGTHLSAYDTIEGKFIFSIEREGLRTDLIVQKKKPTEFTHKGMF